MDNENEPEAEDEVQDEDNEEDIEGNQIRENHDMKINIE